MASTNDDLVWHKVLNADELPEGRVTSATCAHLTLCMTHYQGQYAALRRYRFPREPQPAYVDPIHRRQGSGPISIVARDPSRLVKHAVARGVSRVVTAHGAFLLVESPGTLGIGEYRT